MVWEFTVRDHDITPDRAGVSAPRYLTKQEFVAISGLSASTVHRYKNSGAIPFYQPGGPGGKLLFPPNAIEIAQKLSLDDRTSPLSINRENAASAADAKEVAAHKMPGPRPRWQSRNLSQKD